MRLSHMGKKSETTQPTMTITKTRPLQSIVTAVVFAVITGALLGFFIGLTAYSIVIGTMPQGTNPSGLIGWWSLDENQGNMVKNFVGGKSGQIWYISQTSPWAAGSGPWQVAGALNTGSAVKFDGGRSYIMLDDSFSDVANNQLTISYWIYLKKLPSAMTSGGNPIAMNKYTVKPDGYTPDVVYYTQYFDRTNNKLAIKWIDSTGLAHDKSPFSSQTFTINTWYNITWVFGNGESKLYINGVLDTSTPSFAAQARAGAGRLHLSSPYQSLDGAVIDDVRIYNRVLSNSEVGNIWSKSIPLSLKDIAFFGLKCAADSEGNIDHDNCYQAVDSVCSIQSIKSKNACIESVIQSLSLSNDEYARDIADDLLIKYCLSPLTYEKMQRPFCYGDFFGVSAEKFESETNASLVMDQLNKIMMLPATNAKAGAVSCNYQAVNSCQGLGQIISSAVRSCGGASSCVSGRISSATNASTTVICNYHLTGVDTQYNEVMSLGLCLSKPWLSYCMTSNRPDERCPPTTGCDCGWLAREYTSVVQRDMNHTFCTPIVSQDSQAVHGQSLAGDSEFRCKMQNVVHAIPSCARAVGAHSGGRSAVDIFFDGCVSGVTTSPYVIAAEIINSGRYFIARAAAMTTPYDAGVERPQMYMSEISELTPCEMQARGSSGPHVHVDVARYSSRNTYRPFPCAFINTENPINWLAANCKRGSIVEALYYPLSGAEIKRQFEDPNCSNWYE